MSRKNLIITVLALVGLSTAAVVSAGMRSQRGGMGCSCCTGDMMGMREAEGSGGMQGMGRMEGTGKEEIAQQPLTEGRKEVGEEFTCPVDGMRMTVTENTPATEYRGKTYYFCNEQDKQTFLQDPERYVERQSSR
jgi:YHS domain-containing protein